MHLSTLSVWGNPFRIGRDGDRQDVIRAYEKYVRGNAQLMARLGEMAGRNLAC